MKKIFILALLPLVVSFMGCDPEIIEPPQEEVQELRFTVNSEANGEEITYSDSVYTLPSSEKVTIKRLAYILADFILVKSDGGEVALEDQYVLVKPKFDTPEFTLTNIPQGDYKSIKFSLGLDSAVNHGDPNQYDVTHPLSPQNNALHWSWTGGYIFCAIEGKLADGSNDGFVFHLAGFKNKIDYDLPLVFSKGLESQSAELTLNFDEIFQNPEVYTLATDGMSTHSVDDPVTTKLFGNMGDIFTVNMK